MLAFSLQINPGWTTWARSIFNIDLPVCFSHGSLRSVASDPLEAAQNTQG